MSKLKNYSTKICAKKSFAEISEILIDFDATAPRYQKDGSGLIVGMTFEKTINGTITNFKLPISWECVLDKMKEDKCPKGYCNKEQANNVSWRLMKDTLLYILTMVELNGVKIEEIFLGFMIDSNTGKTLYQHLEETKFKGLLGTGKN